MSSSAAPTRNSRASSKAGPTICIPIGSPAPLNPQGIETMSVTLFGLIYVAWLCNFITRINFATFNGRFFVMYLVVVTKFTDIGAYLTGSAIGRHKMIPPQ